MKKDCLYSLFTGASLGQVDFKNKIWITYVESWHEIDEKTGGLAPTEWVKALIQF